MPSLWIHAAPAALAAFLASAVEGVEALTVILAVGAVRGWRAALTGCLAAAVLLAGVVAIFGASLEHAPLRPLQAIVGALLLLFGLRWLRKAVLRSAGVIALHDEAQAFAQARDRLATLPRTAGWDKTAFAAAFEITALEGAEVVFIVLAIGAGGSGLTLAASFGAVAALALVAVAGLILHRPLARIPENALKFSVAVLLSAFGTFWFGEGAGFVWPGADWSIAFLVLAYFGIAIGTVQICLGARARPLRARRMESVQ